MTDLTSNIWSDSPDHLVEFSARLSPSLPHQSPTLQNAWAPFANPKVSRGPIDALAQARVRAIFRSSRFPNRIDNKSQVFSDLEPDTLNQLRSDFAYDEADDHTGDATGVFPDFEGESSFDAEETFSSLCSSSSSRSTPVEEWTPHWHPLFQAVLSSRSNAECIHACRVLALSSDWRREDLAEIAYQLVSSVLTKVSPVVVAVCAANFERTLLDASKHEAASHFVSCISESAFAAWHHYWNPAMSFSIYPGRQVLVTQEHLDAAFVFCRLLGSLFRMNMISRFSVREIIDLTMQNAVLLEHIDALGNLFSYASPAFWSGAGEGEKDRTMIELYDLVERLCEYHFLRPELVQEYEKKVEEICRMVMDSS